MFQIQLDFCNEILLFPPLMFSNQMSSTLWMTLSWMFLFFTVHLSIFLYCLPHNQFTLFLSLYFLIVSSLFVSPPFNLFILVVCLATYVFILTVCMSLLVFIVSSSLPFASPLVFFVIWLFTYLLFRPCCLTLHLFVVSSSLLVLLFIVVLLLTPAAVKRTGLSSTCIVGCWL